MADRITYRNIDTEGGIGIMVYHIAEILQTKKKTYEHDSTKTPNSSMVVLKPSILHVFIAQPKKSKTQKILHNQAMSN
jgi:hypothetical protein